MTLLEFLNLYQKYRSEANLDKDGCIVFGQNELLFCPITYVALKEYDVVYNIGCYDKAAKLLEIEDEDRDHIVFAADNQCTTPIDFEIREQLVPNV